MLWIVLSWCAGVAANFLFAMAIGFHDGLSQGRSPWSVPPLLVLVVHAGAVQLTLLFGAQRRAAIAGQGNIAEGWGTLPLNHHAIVYGLAAAWPVILLAWIRIDGHWLQFVSHSLPRENLRSAIASDLAGTVGLVLLLSAIAPICEELFFRGWLWTGLRRRWPFWAVAPVTGLLWLAVHYPEGGLERVVTLLPAAIMLSIVREIGGSVYASTLLHIVNNSVATILLTLAITARHA